MRTANTVHGRPVLRLTRLHGGSAHNAMSLAATLGLLIRRRTTLRPVSPDAPWVVDAHCSAACRRRQDDMSSWQEAIVVACKREATAQRLTLVYSLGTGEESFEHDVYLRKGKADVLWRFARPARQLADDWDAVIARDPVLAGYTGGAGGGGGGGGRGSSSAAATPAAKKRKGAAGAGSGAPYSKEALQRAISASKASRQVDELKVMMASIEEQRRSVVGQLALERVRDMLSSMSAPPPCCNATGPPTPACLQPSRSATLGASFHASAWQRLQLFALLCW